jgi:hypothetical protein
MEMALAHDLHDVADPGSASRAWIATLDELGAMPANVWAEAIEATPAANTHPRSNPEFSEEQLRLGVEKLAAVIG